MRAVVQKNKDPLSSAVLTEKVRKFLTHQERMGADFERSLTASEHFLKLAALSAEKESENTIAMLEQIQAIGLLKKLEQQQSAFEALEEGLRQRFMLPQSQQTHPLFAQFREMQDHFAALGREARLQEERLQDLLMMLNGRSDA